MAGPGGAEVGRVSVRVVPDTDKFWGELKAKLEALEDTLKLKVPVELDDDGVVANMRALLTRLQAQARAARVTVPVDVDRRGLGSFLGQGRNGLSGLTQALTRTGNAARHTQKTFFGLTRMGWIMTAVLTLATPALGLIVGLLGSLPVLMSAIGAAGAVMYLGWDGIKKAAQQLSPEIQRLKEVLSARFEERLTPQFARLKPVLSGIEDELLGVADGLSDMFTGFVDVVSSAEGMRQIESILSNTGKFLTDLTPTTKNFTSAFLTLAESGASNLHFLSSALGTFSGRFDEMVKRLQKDGTFDKMFEGFSKTFVGLGDLFNGLFEAGAKAMGTLGDDMGRLLSSLGTFVVDIEPLLSTLSAFTFDNLSYLAEKLGPSLRDATPTVQGLLDAVDPLVKKIIDLAASFIDNLVPALEDATPAIEKIADALVKLGEGLDGNMGWIAPMVAGLWAVNKALKIVGAAFTFLSRHPIMGRLLGLVGIFLALDAGVRATGLSWGNLIKEFIGLDKVTPIWEDVRATWDQLFGDGKFMDFSGQLESLNLDLESWKSAWDGFVNGMKSAWTGLTGWIDWGLLGTGAQSVWDGIQLGWTTLLTTMSSLWSSLTTGIDWGLLGIGFGHVVSGIQQLWNGLLIGLQWAWNGIAGAFDWGLLVEGARNAFRGLQGAWNATSGALIGAVSGFIANMVGLFMGLAGQLGAAASAAWSTVAGAFTSGVATSVGIVATLPGQCLSALGNVGSMLYSSGLALIQGFANGITAGIGAAVSAASSAVSAVRALFPFSPAKTGPFSGRGWVLYSGLSIGDAFAVGIRLRIPDVSSAASDMVTAAHDQFSGMVGGIAAETRNGMNQMIDGVREKGNELGEAAGVEKFGDRWAGVLSDSMTMFDTQLDKLPAKAESIAEQIKTALLEGIDFSAAGDKLRLEISSNLSKTRDELIKQAKDTTNQLGDEAGVEKLGDRWESVLTDSFKVFEHQMQKVPELWAKAMEESKLDTLPQDFAKATGDQFLSDLGIEGKGALPQLVKQITEVHYHVNDLDEAQRHEKNRQAKESLQYTRR